VENMPLRAAPKKGAKNGIFGRGARSKVRGGTRAPKRAKKELKMWDREGLKDENGRFFRDGGGLYPLNI